LITVTEAVDPNDLDADGMPDSWEAIYGLDPLVDDSAGDLDQDGFSNLEEYLQGTNPAVDNAVTSNMDKDLDDDLLWVRHVDNTVKYNELEGGVSVGQGFSIQAYDANYTLLGYGDFDGDRDVDYLWQQASDGSLRISRMENALEQNTISIGVFNTAYELVGSGDTDGDGDDDLVWYRPDDGRTVIFEMENADKIAQNWVGDFLQTAYRPIGLGDVDKDGDDDLWWVRKDLANFESVVVWWFENNTRNPATDVDWLNAYYNDDYEPRAIGDFDADGDDDIVWYNMSSGNVVYWNIEDPDGAHTGTRPQRLSADWVGLFANLDFAISHGADTNGDGNDDLVWHNNVTGTVNVWELQGFSQSAVQNVLPTSDTDFQLITK
jgi:hypothetical protein